MTNPAGNPYLPGSGQQAGMPCCLQVDIVGDVHAEDELIFILIHVHQIDPPENEEVHVIAVSADVDVHAMPT